jgi:integrase/recombinase XerD
MAELVDALDSKSCIRKDVQVRFLFWAQNHLFEVVFFIYQNSCFTGLRWVDIKDLQWKHIDLENEVLNKVQAKTDVKVSVTLNTNALSLLPEKGEKNEFVFALPSHTGALKTLKLWLKKAEIDKHITWHCARHSFATNLIVYDTDVLIVSKLLGHNTLKYTQRYTHVANDLKKKATDSLPKINI